MKKIRVQQLGILRGAKNSGYGLALNWVTESGSGYNRILSLSIQSPYFENLLRSPGIDSQPGKPVRDNPICRTGPPGYIGSRN
jgi:hypothetical protein